MKNEEAGKLISKAFSTVIKPAVWADLGCGEGMFTKALTKVLSPSSTVYAIDKEPQKFIKTNHKVQAFFQIVDFEKDNLELPLLDGILMANSLHYVKDKTSFINKLKQSLNEYGEIIIIEYDTEISNQWVPYPVSFHNLKNLFSQAGFSFIEKMSETKSIYNNETIYSCIIRN